MARRAETLFLGTGRYVAAVRTDTGAELWRTKLPSGSSGIVSILLKYDLLFVGHSGRLYCLRAKDGAILWENGLPRMGYQPVLMAMPAVGSGHDAIAAAQAEAAAHSAAATSASASAAAS